MPKYLIMADGCKWQEVERPVKDLELVYRMESSFISPQTPVAIRDQITHDVKIFTRELDADGNIQRVIEH